MRVIKYLLALLHWSDRAVCEMSHGNQDFHDWLDATGLGTPIHFKAYRCARCRKEFTL